MKLRSVLVALIVAMTTLFYPCHEASAQSVNVRGYYRSNGTYVMPYTRSAPSTSSYGSYSGYSRPEIQRYSPPTWRSTSTYAAPSGYVQGYYRGNGTYVRPYYRRR